MSANVIAFPQHKVSPAKSRGVTACVVMFPKPRKSMSAARRWLQRKFGV